jgi:hypothetical protein
MRAPAFRIAAVADVTVGPSLRLMNGDGVGQPAFLLAMPHGLHDERDKERRRAAWAAMSAGSARPHDIPTVGAQSVRSGGRKPLARSSFTKE